MTRRKCLTEEEFLRKFDNGEKLSGTDINDIRWNFKIIDEIEGDETRWSRWIDVVFEVDNRYFMTGYYKGLTECQEDEYYDEAVIEVKPVEKTVVVKEWEEVKKNG